MLTTSDRLHVDCMSQALRLARLCEPVPTAFCVGCIITKTASASIISDGYSRELAGNTHAEQNALQKLIAKLDKNSTIFTTPPINGDLQLYTTMEPCSKRLSNNKSCTELILEFNQAYQPEVRIRNVYLGVVEPSDFVNCDGTKRLSDAGIQVVQVVGFSEQCLKVARGSH